MFKRLARIPLTLLTALTAVFALQMGCSDTEPVSSSFSAATVNLSPKAFPAPPDGMIYELWLQKLDGSNTSLGRFGWDQKLYLMRDSLNSGVRERSFDVNLNILEWDFISVSIEEINIPSVSGPGPIFMRDTIFAPEEREILLMKYPIDFSGITTGFVSIETPTDGDFSNDSAGVWFAIYSRSSTRTQDTIGASATELTQVPRNASADLANGNTLDTIGIDSVMDVAYDRYTRFNLDTFNIHTVRSFFATVPINPFDTTGIDSVTTTITVDTTIDTVMVPPDTTITADTVLDTFYIVDSAAVQYVLPQYTTPGGATYGPDTIQYGANRDYRMQQSIDTTSSIFRNIHQFDNGFSELFDLRGTGWHYKGWVLGPFKGASAQEFVRMNLGENKETNWEKEGRTLFTTGIFYDTVVIQTFNKFDTTDFGKNPDGSDSIIVRSVYNYSGEAGYNTVGSNTNPFAASPAVSLPPFPGEDFLTHPFVGGTGPVFDFHGAPGDTTIAFITVEPDNYADSTKNFPLVLMSVEINFSRGSSDGGATDGSLDLLNDHTTFNNNFEMRNQSPVNFPIANKRKSWPHILVDIKLK